MFTDLGRICRCLSKNYLISNLINTNHYQLRADSATQNSYPPTILKNTAVYPGRAVIVGFGANVAAYSLWFRSDTQTVLRDVRLKSYDL